MPLQTFHTFRPPLPPESKEVKQNRLSAKRAAKAHRSAKLGRTRRGEIQKDVELANIFNQLGVDFFSTNRVLAFQRIPEIWNARKVEGLPQSVVDFVVDNFEAEVVEDPMKSYAPVFLFPATPRSTEMRLLDRVAKHMGVHKRDVEKFYSYFVNEIHGCLATDREVHLSSLGRLYVKSIPAKPKRKGTNPSTGKRIWLEPKPAGNKVRFSVSKRLKHYVAGLNIIPKQ